MSINIHGKEYITVAERVKAIHEAEKTFSMTTEVLAHDPVLVKATVTTPKGIFTGISAANPDKTIEKITPYEVAETSAVGRALGFAGYGIVDGIATADELVKAGVKQDLDDLDLSAFTSDNMPKRDSSGRTICSECGALVGHAVEKFSMEKYGRLLCMNCQKKATAK